MSEHLAIESGLRNGEFFLEYQPIVELDRGRCLGAEALVRWRRPRGVSQPAEFLPFIPETRIFPDILPLGCSKGSLRTSLAWLKIHDAFISINLQPEIIGRGGLADRIGLVEVKHRIMLEIAAHGVPDRLGVDTLNHGVERELRYALDDVGAETNPIALSRSNVDMIKIARALVSQVRLGKPLPAALQSIASPAQTNKLAVVAVGVESADQVAILKGAGIPMAQGYYFSGPLSADAFRAYFAYDRGD